MHVLACAGELSMFHALNKNMTGYAQTVSLNFRVKTFQFRGKLWLFCEGLFPPPQIHRMYFTYTSEEVAGVQPYEEASQKDLFCIPSPVARSFSFPSICVSESAVVLVACNTSDTLTLKSAACTFCKKHMM